MAHYDCSSCGEREGIAYGICRDCTPQIVFDKKAKLNAAVINAQRAFDRSVEQLRKQFVDAQIKDAQAEYDLVFNKFRPGGNYTVTVP